MHCIFVFEQLTLRAFTLLIFVLFSNFLIGQIKSDVENEVIKKNTSQTTIQMLNTANKMAGKNAEQSMKIALEALKKSLNEGDKRGEYYAYSTLGTLYFNIGNYSRASSYFKSARDGFKKIDEKKGLTYVEKYLTASLEKEKKFNEALVISNEADKRGYSDKNAETKSKYNKARLKSKSGYKKEAIKDLERLTRDSTIKEGDKIEIYLELGDLYVAEKDTTSAYESYSRLLEFNTNNTAGSPSFNSERNEALLKLSEINLKRGNVKENIAIQNKLLLEGLYSKDVSLVQTTNYTIGTSFIEANQNREAIPYLYKSVKYSREIQKPKEEQKSVKELAKAYENLGEYDKALAVYKRYVQLSDSFRELNLGNEEKNLALNKEFLKQEATIKGLMNSQKEKEASLKRQKKITFGLITVLLIFSILTWALYRNIKHKQKANMLVKLQSLRTQMNPHFIFNSLNSVNNFIAKNDERSANKYLSDFSKLMRSVLKNSDQDFVTFTTEIETLRIYLELEHFRFGDKFEYRLTVSSDIETEAFQVPPMLIQPYIENAIWHGLRYREEKGMLEVNFFIKDQKLFCTIRDNGIGRKRSSELKTVNQKSYQSTGIKNTKERIEILNKLHKTTLGIEIEDLWDGEDAAGTLVKISLPYRLSEIPV
ncbi:MAG: histidine kinase [Flavobacteriales bacterium]|nr:histidine kinase [Flavobacteriales bacterium]